MWGEDSSNVTTIPEYRDHMFSSLLSVLKVSLVSVYLLVLMCLYRTLMFVQNFGWDTVSKSWTHMDLHLPHPDGDFGVTFTFSQERQGLWLTKDDLKDSSSMSRCKPRKKEWNILLLLRFSVPRNTPRTIPLPRLIWERCTVLAVVLG